jgi:hypothetical protein
MGASLAEWDAVMQSIVRYTALPAGRYSIFTYTVVTPAAMRPAEFSTGVSHKRSPGSSG